MRYGYRAKVFLATFGIAAVVVLFGATWLAVSLRRQTYARIERGLVSEARLASELLSRDALVRSEAELQDEALSLGKDIDARVTLIANDGRVVGDSSQTAATLTRLENHGQRPEVLDARQHGIGIESRSSATLGVGMLYVAATVRHPSVAIVRLALPLTEIDRQLQTIWRAALYALAVSVMGALGMAWLASSLLARRLSRLADTARSYAADDRALPMAFGHGDDEIGTVARVLDEAMARIAQRAADAARDRARMEAILAAMEEGVIVVDADGRVQLVNPAARGLLRIGQEAIGRHFVEFVRQPAIASQLDAARNGVVEVPASPVVIGEGGRAFVARAASVPAAGAVLVLHDVTDLHRADQIRRDFVANVSHELRTPLTAIRGYVETLQDEPIESDDRRGFLDIIARHAQRMERLATDLLRLASLEAGQDPPRAEPCRVTEVFAVTVGDLQSKMDDRRQSVDIAVDADAAIVEADPHQLQDAVKNLLENAVIYSPPGSCITLAAHRVHDRILLTVADEGPGIPPDALARVFERFYRVDRGRSRESGGTGLGLAIVKHLVEGMQGSVKAANRPAGGAIFTIDLPVLRQVADVVSTRA
jgi:two-component system phosphate regulon sensor histidine kinase PhoR